MVGWVGVQKCLWGTKENLFLCCTMKELGEDSCEKEGSLVSPKTNM